MERICSVYILDVPYSADRPYSYAVPGDMAEEAVPGAFVEVPFGRGNRPVTGLCVAVTDPGEDCADTKKLKYLVRTLGGTPVLDEELLGLCRFLKDHTLCTMGDAVRTVIPSGALGKVTEYYRAVPDSLPNDGLPRDGLPNDGLMEEIRGAIEEGRYQEYKKNKIEAMRNGEE